MADTVRIYEDQENRVPGVGVKNKRQGLRPLGANGKAAGQRTAFGLLSTSQNTNTRVQPPRAARQAVNCEPVTLDHYQDENAYVKPKVFNQNVPGLKIYSDESENTTKSSSISLSTTAFSSISNNTTVDKSSLEYATSKLDIPACLTTLQRPEPLVLSNGHNSELMDLGGTDEDSTAMSVATPCRPQEDILKQREENLWDMTEYAADIYNYLRKAEEIHRPRANYMSKQTDITTSMRWILVDWMVEVGEEYTLSAETLYLAVSYIDRFLSHMSVKRDKLQLVGTTALFIAAKYEEIYPPEVAQFAYITDNTYKVQHILRMEHLILKVLSFDMAVPTAYCFIKKFARALGCTEATTCLALFVSELTMLESEPFLRYNPSLIGASALAIANFTQGHTAWPSIMEQTYEYKLEDLRECYVNLNRTYSKVHEIKAHAIREKYKDKKFHVVSAIPSRTDLPF